MNKVYLIWYDNGYVCVLDAVTTTEKLAKEYIDNADCSKYYSIEERELYNGEDKKHCPEVTNPCRKCRWDDGLPHSACSNCDKI